MTAAARVRELADPAVFGVGDRVDIVQTHLSVVCLVGDRVYKFKKPVRLPFVDFTMLGRRRAACREEVRLNRRLAPATYLGTAVLRRGPHGLRLDRLDNETAGDDADVVDVAVVMARLPQALMLDELLAARAVGPSEVRGLARVVAAFHAAAERGPAVARQGAPDRLVAFARANFPELAAASPECAAGPLFAAAAAASERAMAALLPALQRRAAAGKVVDGHGDLHARNICMTEPPVVYDCIEFEPAFRCGDVATEVAFLVMDLRYRGAPDLARAFVAEYAALAGDGELPSLLPPLCAYRAMVRAKVAALAAREASLSAADRTGAAASAQRHLEHAAVWLVESRPPRWLVLCGPPATGKSTLAAALSTAAAWPAAATDVVRKELAGLPPEARGGPELHTRAFDDATYGVLAERAARATAAGAPMVVLDGNFATRARRQAVAAAAARAGAAAVFACVTVPLDEALARAARRASGPSPSDADRAVAAKLHAAFEPPDELPDRRRIDVDGTAIPAAVQVLLAALLRPDP